MISVIIPTYSAGDSVDQERLDLILAALADQRLGSLAGEDSLEVVIADDGSPAPLSLPAAWRWPLISVRQEDLGFRAAAARNLGAQAAQGDVLVFLDADTVPSPDYLDLLTAPLRSGTADLSVGRRDHAHLTGPEAGTPLDAPLWLADAYARTDGLRAADARAYQFVISAVLAIRTETFHEAGGFDETLVGYGGEDWALAHAAWQIGARFLHVPGAVATHDGPDWGGRGGRSHPEALRVKNAETRALAHRIAASWTRPPGVLFETPELLVRLALPATVDDDAAAAWACALLAERPDAHILVEAGRCRGLTDPRIRIAGEEPALPRTSPRYVLEATGLCDPAYLTSVIDELDAAPENGPFGGANRRAEIRVEGVLVARLASTRALSLARDGSTPATRPTTAPLTTAAGRWPDQPDLERMWAGW